MITATEIYQLCHLIYQRMMMNEQTLSKLHEMKLSGMAEAYKEQTSSKEFQKVSFKDRFSLLVECSFNNLCCYGFKINNFKYPDYSHPIEPVYHYLNIDKGWLY